MYFIILALLLYSFSADSMDQESLKDKTQHLKNDYLDTDQEIKRNFLTNIITSNDFTDETKINNLLEWGNRRFKNGEESSAINQKILLERIKKEEEDKRLLKEKLKKMESLFNDLKKVLIKEKEAYNEELQKYEETLKKSISMNESLSSMNESLIPMNKMLISENKTLRQELEMAKKNANLTRNIAIGVALTAIGIFAVNTVMSKQTSGAFSCHKNS